MKCPYCKEDIADGSLRCKECHGDIAKHKGQKIAAKIILGFIILMAILAVIGSIAGGPTNGLDPDYKACRDKWRDLGGDSTEEGKQQNALCSNLLRNNLSR